MPQKINERPFTGKCSWGIKASSSCGQINNVWLPIPTVLVHNIVRAHWENLTKSGANIHLDSKKVTLTSHRFVVSSVFVKMISQVTLKEILCLQVWHECLLGLKEKVWKIIKKLLALTQHCISETFFITWILHLTNVISSDDSSCTPLISPCSRPMRKRASVIERIGWEQKWARIGVKAVIEPQAAADSRRTFSPPTLWTEHRWVALALTFAY